MLDSEASSDIVVLVSILLRKLKKIKISKINEFLRVENLTKSALNILLFNAMSNKWPFSPGFK